MAYEIDGFTIGTMTASTDLSSSQFYIVDVSGDNTVTTAGVAGQAAIGVLQNAPESGEAAAVRTMGISKVVAGTGDLTAGDQVQAAADGTGITAATGDFTIGICIIGAAAGENATILVQPSGGQVN